MSPRSERGVGRMCTSSSLASTVSASLSYTNAGSCTACSLLAGSTCVCRVVVLAAACARAEWTASRTRESVAHGWSDESRKFASATTVRRRLLRAGSWRSGRVLTNMSLFKTDPAFALREALSSRPAPGFVSNLRMRCFASAR